MTRKNSFFLHYQATETYLNYNIDAIETTDAIEQIVSKEIINDS